MHITYIYTSHFDFAIDLALTLTLQMFWSVWLERVLRVSEYESDKKCGNENTIDPT